MRIQPPSTIRNVPLWEEHCRKIRARAIDLIQGKFGVIETSREISKLASWAHLREDADVTTFIAIDDETATLPVGEVRKYWAEHALVAQDVEICRAEAIYREVALDAAQRIVRRFEWTLDARSDRRNAGHAV